MGRPKKKLAERRGTALSFRVTAAERLKIEEAARRAGLSASDYARARLLTGKLIIRENRRLDYAAFDQLRRIGVNLNQLTRLANRTGFIAPKIETVLREIERLIAREISPGSAKDSAGDNASFSGE